MSDLIQRLRSVQERVARVVQERDAFQGKVSALEAQAREGHRTTEVLRARIAELERENEVLRTSRAASGSAGTPEAKQRIDELVHEIDRCLALISA